MKTIKLENAKCTAMQNHAPIEFLKGSDRGTFQIEAYTGAVVDRYWGKLAIEVDGIKAKPALPVLRDHDSSQIVGFSTNTGVNGGIFIVEGAFSNTTETAKEVRALAEEGFPWQASIGVAPRKIVSLESDGEMVVNGKTLKGPAEVWLESEVFETSFLPCGADSETSVQIFSEPGRKPEGLVRGEWDNEPAIRHEFNGDYEAYLAYRENEQMVKTCNAPCRTYHRGDF